MIGDDIETYCWVMIREFDKKEDFDLERMTELSDEMIQRLMIDIAGEAG